MPWNRLASWFANQRFTAQWPTEPMTLVTLALNDHARPEEVAFYSEAEVTALSSWALSGGFILALAAVGRNELTMLCPTGLSETAGIVEQLPMVANGLARFDIRGVTPLRMGHSASATPRAH